MNNQNIKQRDVADFPTFSEEHYRIIERHDYVRIPKQRLKSIVLVEDVSNGIRKIRLVDRWVIPRFQKGGKLAYLWGPGKSYSIHQGEDMKTISTILKWFGRKLGMNVDDGLDEQLVRSQKEVQELSLRLAEKNQTLQNLQEERAKLDDELKLAKQISGDLKRFATSLVELNALITKSKNENVRNEAEVKKCISSNRWILGLDCEVRAKELPIDNETALDIHIKTDWGEDRIFEFKSPNLAPFLRKRLGSRLSITPELSDGLHQLIEYLRRTDLYSQIQASGVYGVRKPAGIIVIGYKLGKDELAMLADWNFHLRPHIRIITYDELLESAMRNLECIRGVRKDSHQVEHRVEVSPPLST